MKPIAPPTLIERCTYALMGLISGGLLSLITIVPLGLLMSRKGRGNSTFSWVFVIVVPVVFSLSMALWGFISTQKMIDKLSDWWDSAINRHNS